MQPIVEFLKALAALGAPLFLLVALFGAMAGVTRRRKRVGPNEALIVYGRGRTTFDEKGEPTKMGARIVTAGGTVVLPVLEESRMLSLRVMTIEVKEDKVITGPGVDLYLDWVAQLQIAPDELSILTAARAFLGKEEPEIKGIATDALSGNFREVVATLTPEEIHMKKEKFSVMVREYAAPEMAALGLRIVSLTVREIADKVGYFEALGRPRIAEVRKNATIAEAEANRDARVKAAEAGEMARTAEVEAETRIAEAEKNRDLLKAGFKEATDTKKAIADRAYDLQDTGLREELAKREGAVAVEVQRQAGLAAEQAITVAERTQQAETVIPAEAEKRAAVEKATGESEAIRLEKKAEADGIRATGEAGAKAKEAGLLAEAKGQRELADARAAMGEINLRQHAIDTIIKARVDVAKAYADAMVNFTTPMRVVQFAGAPGAPGAGQTGIPAIDALLQVPEVGAMLNAKVEALTGKDLAEVMAEALEMARGTKAVATQQPEETES